MRGIAITGLAATFLAGALLPAGAQQAFDGLEVDYTITSVGIVDGSMRTVTLDSARRISWAQYALWSNNNRDLYFKDGEEFDGAVHANTALYFSGDPVFHGKVTSAASWYGGSIADAVFDQGLTLNVPVESMSSVDFGALKSKASQILAGTTEITLNGTNMVVTNSRQGWNNRSVPIPYGGLIYIEDARTGASGSRPAYLSIEGELNSRVTFVAERDINITDHLTYSVDPRTNSASTDALGLIANGDVVVTTGAPDNLSVFAHILATGNRTPSDAYDGSFRVANYNYGSPRGVLTIHGGIAQDYRGAVGTFSIRSGQMLSGFEKNYTYDRRFARNPPPHYPPLDNRMHPGVWRAR